VNGIALALTLLATLRAVAGEPPAVEFDQDESHAGWWKKKSKAGITLEQRKVHGSAFREYRVVVEVPVDPSFAAAEIWTALRSGDVEDLKRRVILREEPDRLVIHDQIRTAVVSDRDYVIDVSRLFDAAGQRTEIRIDSTTDPLAPSPARGYVRMAKIRAGWLIEPGGNGGTRLTLWAYSEPGGSIPAFLARGPQGERTLDDMLRMMRRLRAGAAAGAHEARARSNTSDARSRAP
jgi:hypothetical protein